MYLNTIHIDPAVLFQCRICDSLNYWVRKKQAYRSHWKVCFFQSAKLPIGKPVWRFSYSWLNYPPFWFSDVGLCLQLHAKFIYCWSNCMFHWILKWKEVDAGSTSKFKQDIFLQIWTHPYYLCAILQDRVGRNFKRLLVGHRKSLEVAVSAQEGVIKYWLAVSLFQIG